MRSIVIASALIATAFLQHAAAQPAATDAVPVALVVTYADGRTVSTIIGSRRARSWTPMFPRVPGSAQAEGALDVEAIQYFATRAGEDVRVVVSVLLGRPHQQERTVADVLVRAGAPVRIEGLSSFGVEPVELSLAPVGALALHPLVIENETSGLLIEGVELVSSVPPRYRITVANRSARAAVSFHVASFRGSRPALSTRQSHPRGVPVVPVGETYTFDLALSGTVTNGDQPVSPEPLDTIALKSVLWDDGTSDGEVRPAAEARVGNIGRLAQLRRIVDALEEATREESTDHLEVRAAFRQWLETVPIETTAPMIADAIATVGADILVRQDVDVLLRAGMQRVKDLALQDVASSDEAGDRSPRDAQAWLARTLSDYRAWYERLQESAVQ